MIHLRPTERTQREIAEFLRRADDLAAPNADAIRPIQETIRAAFDLNFQSESAGGDPWAPLAPFTQRERARLGFPPQHPILQRTGDYRRSFTEEDHPAHISEWEAVAGRWRVAEGSADERAQELEEGRANMPARPVTDIGEPGDHLIAVTLEYLFNQWFEDDTP